MSLVVKGPGEPIPFTHEQLAPLCMPETTIDPTVFLDDESWGASRYGLFYVKDGTPIGVAFCSIAGGDEGIERHIQLHVLCVSQTERKSGVGRKVLAAVDALAREKGLTSIRLLAISTQVSFYERNGFGTSGDDDGGYTPMKKTLAGGTRRAKPRRRPRKTRRVRATHIVPRRVLQ